MSRCLYFVRGRFHPLNSLRRYAVSRAILRAMDLPIWVNLPDVNWKVRMRLVRHAVFFVIPGGAEPGICALVRSIAQQFGIRSFWDVEANIGVYTWLVKSIAPEAEIRMFEPDPDNLALVRETIHRENLANIAVREVAVTDNCGTRCFARDLVSGSTGCIEDGGTSFSERMWGVATSTLRVRSVSLDDERATAEAVDLIKIDVEGHEEAVILGALKTIRRDRPIVIVECFHGGDEIVGGLSPFGYSFLDAERMAADICRATNFVAFPKRHLAQLDELMRRWKDNSARA
jgi:FkbM family methyltransferase